jgi:hypothetical protein
MRHAVEEKLAVEQKNVSLFTLTIGSGSSYTFLNANSVKLALHTRTFEAIRSYNLEHISTGYMSGSIYGSHIPGVQQVTARPARTFLPYLRRADCVAVRCRRSFRRFSAAVGLLASAAVAAALTQLALFPRQQAFTWVELACLLPH